MSASSHFVYHLIIQRGAIVCKFICKTLQTNDFLKIFSNTHFANLKRNWPDSLYTILGMLYVWKVSKFLRRSKLLVDKTGLHPWLNSSFRNFYCRHNDFGSKHNLLLGPLINISSCGLRYFSHSFKHKILSVKLRGQFSITFVKLTFYCSFSNVYMN